MTGQGQESRKKKEATEWIDEKEELTLRSPDWGKEEQKRWQGNRPCGNVAPTKAASSLHENPLGLEGSLLVPVQGNQVMERPRSVPDAGLSVLWYSRLPILGCMYSTFAVWPQSVSLPGPDAPWR